MKRFVIISAVFACIGVADAQNINQTVEVSNNYVVNFGDFRKSEIEPTIADSLYKFDYSFDYSVFDSPYKGSYEFSPYEVNMIPETRQYDGKSLYLRAGAGMALYPVMDVVYNVVQEDRLAVSIYNSGRGHYGHFETLAPERGGLPGFKGCYFNDEIGASGRMLFEKNKLDFNVSATGIFANPAAENHVLLSPHIRAAFSSMPESQTHLAYDVDLSYRYVAMKGPKDRHNIRLQGFIAPVLNYNYELAIDYDLQMAGGNSFAQFKPHLDFRYKFLQIDAGLKMDVYTDYVTKMSPSLAPSATVSVDILDKKLVAFAAVDGGRFVTTEYELWSYCPMYLSIPAASVCSGEPLNVYLGIKGDAFSYLQYELKGGYRFLRNVYMEGLRSVGLHDLNLAYADAGIKWDSPRLDVDALLSFNYGKSRDALAQFYLPALVTAKVNATYNWLERVYAGVSLDFSSARKFNTADVAKVPAYVDLGFYGEYRLDSKWSIWGKLGNVLGMSIERHPGFVEKWPYFTFGICLNL